MAYKRVVPKEQQMGLYFDYYCLQRLSLTLDDSHLIQYKEKPLEPIARLPFFDKVTGCMSSLIDATAELVTHNNWGTNLQRIVEIITPIGWAHGFVNYPKVMKSGENMAYLLTNWVTMAI
jgi:hypothetical protein